VQKLERSGLADVVIEHPDVVGLIIPRQLLNEFMALESRPTRKVLSKDRGVVCEQYSK
jgi:hypothetical protein